MMEKASDIVAAELEKFEFKLPGAGGLKGRLTIAPAWAKALAEEAIKAIALPATQKKAVLLALPKYQQDYIASRTFTGPSAHEVLVRLVRKGIDAERAPGQRLPASGTDAEETK